MRVGVITVRVNDGYIYKTHDGNGDELHVKLSFFPGA